MSESLLGFRCVVVFVNFVCGFNSQLAIARDNSCQQTNLHTLSIVEKAYSVLSQVFGFVFFFSCCDGQIFSSSGISLFLCEAKINSGSLYRGSVERKGLSSFYCRKYKYKFLSRFLGTQQSFWACLRLFEKYEQDKFESKFDFRRTNVYYRSNFTRPSSPFLRPSDLNVGFPDNVRFSQKFRLFSFGILLAGEKIPGLNRDFGSVRDRPSNESSHSSGFKCGPSYQYFRKGLEDHVLVVSNLGVHVHIVTVFSHKSRFNS